MPTQEIEALRNTHIAHRISGHFLALAMGRFSLLAAYACGDTLARAPETPPAPAGMFSIMPTTEPPIAGDQFGVEIDLAATPAQTPEPTPEPTYTSQPTPTHMPEPINTPVPTPTPTYTPVPTPTPL